MALILTVSCVLAYKPFGSRWTERDWATGMGALTGVMIGLSRGPWGAGLGTMAGGGAVALVLQPGTACTPGCSPLEPDLGPTLWSGGP